MNNNVRVLVVDDERVVREGCQRVLTGKGYEVVTASDGQQAMEVLAENATDIMLLDLKMPVMSGEEVLEQTQTLYPDLPVIIITGHGTIDTAVECMKKGAYDFVTKPFQIDQFLLTINRAAEKRRLEQQAKEFQAEKERNLYDLNLEKSRLKTIINCMADGVMVTNRRLEVVLHNPALVNSLGVTGHIENPVALTELTDNESLIDTLREIQTHDFEKQQLISQEIKAGEKTLRSISAPVLGPDGQAVGTVTVLQDITAFKKLDEMKSDFVNMVAHELRSPLVAVRQQSSVLLEGLAGPLHDKQQELVGKGLKKTDQLLELINDLLDIAKIEAGKPLQHRVPVNLCQLVEETVGLLETRAQAEGVSLSYSCNDVKSILADPKGIEEVLSNLVTNAINYSPEGGQVTLDVSDRNEYVEMRVTDTGVGIAPEELPKIFDKFYRVKHPKTRQVMGTGLGLAIVKGIVDAHHGKIDVQSVPDEGTTIRILLPITE